METPTQERELPASEAASSLNDPPNVSRELRALLEFRVLQLAALVLLFVTVGALAFHYKFCVLDPDLWWHLKVGDWILDHHAVPHTGILSRTAANRPWVAYSWGYEVLLSRAYAWFGLIGIGVYGTLLTMMVAGAIYWMLRRLSGQFWIACTGTAMVCSAFLFNGMPRPFFFSIALFAVTLTLLIEANRTGNVRLLYWLPWIFLLWANLHIQFIYGLFVLGLFIGVNLLQRIAQFLRIAPDFVQSSSLPPATVALVGIACVAGTLAGPYFYHPYQVVLEYSKAKFTYSVIQELQPLTFRGASNFVQLFTTAAGFFAVGWKKKLDLFKLTLLIAATVIAYRTMRDAWFICLPAAACIADALMSGQNAKSRESYFAESWREKLAVAGVTTVMLALVANGLGFNQRELDRAISSQYPVNAINFLRRNPPPGPLYNALTWGGFLMWYMPQYPVAIDGRNDLYGDDLDKIFFDSQNGEKSYQTDPYLDEAGVVLLNSDLPLAKLLSVDPRFDLIYHDQVATAYVKKMPH